MGNDKLPLNRYQGSWLKRQLGWWVSLSIISAETREKIMALYLWEKAGARVEGKGLSPVKVLTAFGSILIGLGVILFISFNWQHMTSFMKIGTVAAGIILCHLSAVLLNLNGFDKSGVSMALLGNLLYGSGIYLVAQVFNIIGRFPNGIFLWALGSALTVYMYRSKLNYFFVTGLFMLWVIIESLGYKTANYMFVPILLVIMMPLGYWLKTKAGIVLNLFVTWCWLIAGSFIWASDYLSIVQMMPAFLFGVLVYVVSCVHMEKERLKEFSSLYKGSGIAFMIASSLAFANVGIFEKAEFIFNKLPVPSFLCMSIMLVLIALVYSRSVKNRDRLVIPLIVFSGFLMFFLPGMKYFRIVAIVPSAVTMFGLYYVKRMPVFPVAVAVYFPFYMVMYSFRWESVFVTFSLIMIIAVIYYSFNWVDFKGRKLELKSIYGYFGLIMLLLFLYFFSFKSIVDPMFINGDDVNFEFWVIWGILLAVSMLAAFKSQTAKIKPMPFESAAMFSGIIFSMLLIVCLVNTYNYVYVSGIANLLIIILSIGLILTGYKLNENGLKIAGFIFVILEIVSRYFDSSWDFLTRSAMFISIGVILLAGGILLEKNKNKLLVKAGEKS